MAGGKGRFFVLVQIPYERAFLCFICSLSFVGFLTVLIGGARSGPVVTWDSAYYTSTAESLRAGLGFTQWDYTAYQLWPPLYPLVLAVGELETVARFVGAISFAGTIFVSGLIGREVVGLPLAVFAPVAVLVATPLVDICLYVLSEPLFVLLTAWSLFFLILYLRGTRGRRFTLVISAALAGLILTRRNERRTGFLCVDSPWCSMCRNALGAPSRLYS
jgi:hypothetical protein